MKKLLFIAALFATVSANAQVEEENLNIKAQKELAEKGYFGSFTHRVDEVHGINVNYAITPKVPTTEVSVNLHTPYNYPVSIEVTTPQGKKVASVSLKRDEYIKEGTIDVSALPAGKYMYVITWDGESAYEIPFEKK